MPWLLQKYITDVYTYGFAYATSMPLKGKKFILSFTCGGGEKSYTHKGLYHCTIEEIMSPVYATGRYCRLEYLGQIISYHMMPEDCPEERIVEKARSHAARLVNLFKK